MTTDLTGLRNLSGLVLEAMRVRYEPFGGIVVLDRPAATIHVNRAWMRRLGYADSPLWALKSLVLACLMLIALLAACKPTSTAPPPPPSAPAMEAKTPTPRPVQPTGPPLITAVEMQWETTGGGAIAFDITRAEQGFSEHEKAPQGLAASG